MPSSAFASSRTVCLVGGVMSELRLQGEKPPRKPRTRAVGSICRSNPVSLSNWMQPSTDQKAGRDPPTVAQMAADGAD